VTLQVLILTAVLYGLAGYTFLPNRPWMFLAFVCWAIANVAMGLDAMQAKG
jgi:hypothetical protein